jgi:NAD+ synthase (glutamine-hydrolysing)
VGGLAGKVSSTIKNSYAENDVTGTGKNIGGLVGQGKDIVKSYASGKVTGTDSCGGLAVIGDLYKTEVYQLCEYINRDEIRIPVNTITKAPSAELRPGQKDSDSLPDYDTLDAVLNLYLDESMCEDEIVEEGYDRELVHNVIRKVGQNEWKRLQFAPQLKVSPLSFGLDRRWPIS